MLSAANTITTRAATISLRSPLRTARCRTTRRRKVLRSNRIAHPLMTIAAMASTEVIESPNATPLVTDASMAWPPGIEELHPHHFMEIYSCLISSPWRSETYDRATPLLSPPSRLPLGDEGGGIGRQEGVARGGQPEREPLTSQRAQSTSEIRRASALDLQTWVAAAGRRTASHPCSETNAPR